MNVNGSSRSASRSWPVLDDAALHGLTGEVVKMLLPHTEADPAALVVDFLAGFGAMAGLPTGPWPHTTADAAAHPARLNVLVVGETSRARKSSAFNQIRSLFHVVDPQFIHERVHSGFGSGEAIIDDVAESSDKRMWLVEHEFSRVLVAADREGSIISHVIRQAWDGDRLQVRTRKKKVVADDAHVSVTGHITLDELRSNVRDRDATSGFLNRFLIVCAQRSKLLPSGGNVDHEELRRMARKIKRALKKTEGIEKLVRSDQAEAFWRRLYKRMANDNPGGLLDGVVARSEAQVLRLSVAYALIDGSSVIRVQHLRAAWAVWCYCRASAAYVFGWGIVADTIFDAVVDAGRPGLSRTQVHELFGRHQPVRIINAALGMLKHEGVVEIYSKKSGTGRPNTLVRVSNGTAAE